MQILKPVAVALIALAPLVPLTGTTALAAAKPADRPSDKAVKKEPDRSAQKKEADKPAKKEPEKSAKKDDKPAKKEPEKAAKREPEKPATKPTEHPAKAAAEKPAAKPVESERARVLPGAPAPASPATASRIAVAAPAEIERNAILSDLAWTGDYQGGGATDAPAAAVKAFQKRNGSRETGVLSIDDRAKLAQAAKARQEQAGWRVIDDPVTGARLGIPENLVSLSAPGKSGSRWQSRHGEVQVETFRAAEAGTTIAAVFAQQKAEPAGRKIQFNQLRGDSFIISGLQGLKKFQVRAQAANGEVRGIAVSYDQALEGTMDRVAAAISSTYAAFPPRMVNAAAPRRKVEYGTGVVVNNAGYIVTDLDLLTACDLIVVPGLGPAERVAEDRDASLALVRLNGVHGLAAVGVAPAEARAARAARAAAVAEAAAAAAAAKAVAAANERAALAAAGAKREEAVGPATGTSPAGAPAAQASATETEELTKAESGRAVTAGASLDSPTAAAADGDVKNGEAPTGATAGPETAKGADTGAGEGETARTEQQGAEGAGQKVFTDTEAAKTSSAELAAANPAADIVKAEVQKAEVAKTEILKTEVPKTEQPVSTIPAVRAASPVATIPVPSPTAVPVPAVAPSVVTPAVVDASAPDTSVTVVGIADPQMQGGGRAVSTLRGSVAANGIEMTIDPAPVMGFAGAGAVDNNGYLAGIVTQRRAAGTFQPALAPSTAVAQFLSAHNVTTSSGRPALDEVKAATVRLVCVRN